MSHRLNDGHDIVMFFGADLQDNAAPGAELVDQPLASRLISAGSDHNDLFVQGRSGRAEQGMQADYRSWMSFKHGI